MSSSLSASAGSLRRFVAIASIILATMAAMPAFCGDMDAYIKAMTDTCKRLTEEKEKLTRLAYQRGAKATEENAQHMAIVKQNVATVQKLLSEDPPNTPAERDAYVQKINDLIGSANMEIRSAQKSLGVNQIGAIDINAQDFMQRFSHGFDGGANVEATPAQIDIPRHRDTNFFATKNCKDEVNRHAAAGAAAFQQCAACSDADIQQHLAELRRLQQKELASCEGR